MLNKTDPVEQANTSGNQSVRQISRMQKGRFLKHVIYVLMGNPITLAAFGLFALILIAAVLGPSIVPYDPLATNADNALKPPTLLH